MKSLRDKEPVDEAPVDDDERPAEPVVEGEKPDEAVDVVEETEESKEDAETTSDTPRRRPRFPRSRKARIILAVVLVAVLGAGAGGYFWFRADTLPDGVAFRFDGQDVTADQLNEEAATLRGLYGVQPPTDPSTMDTFRRAMAKASAVSRILERAARDANIVIADKNARDVLTRYISQQFGDGASGRDEFVRALGSVGTSEPAVLKEISRLLAVSQLFNRVTEGTTVTDEEVRQAFEQRRTQLGTPEQREIRNIVVGSEDQANQLLTRLRGGASFEDLAKQYSLDGSTRDSGGDLGVVSAVQLDGKFAQAAFGAPLNDVFGPVQTEHGWNIGKIVRIVPPVPAVLDTVKDGLRQQLVLEKSMNRWRDWLGEQIRDARVRYADDYRPSDPDAPPSAQPGQPDLPGAATVPPGR